MSQSAWSLALIAQWRARRSLNVPITVWIPDFFCNTSLAALRCSGARLMFYPLTEKMAPDMLACRALLDTAPPDMFLLVHYFGQPVPAGAARDFCIRNGAWLVEDAAHVMRPIGGVGTYGDFVLYSPHKHLPIPEGAVLVVRTTGPAQLGADQLESFGTPSNWPEQLVDLQHSLGCSLNGSRARAVVWLIKRVLQKFGVRSSKRSTPPFSELLSSASRGTPRLNAPPPGALAKRLLASLLGNLDAVARYRERHQLLWDALLLGDAGPRPAVAAAERPVRRAWTPYLAGYRVDAENAEATYVDWRSHGLPVTTWPDLPPEVAADPARHPNAWHLRHSRVYLPVHQSLHARDPLAHLPSATSGGDGAVDLRAVWDAVTRAQWHAWVAQSERSNLLQTWEYGLAKSGTSAWRVRRCVFYSDDQPLAIVQVLERRVAGILTLSRVNRGPIFLRAARPHERDAVWKELACLGRLRNGRVLTIAAEADLTGSALAELARVGFRQFSPVAWESVWIDLTLELEALRKQLDGKWRNMLGFAEKAGVQCECGSDDRAFDWMMDRYAENMRERNFSGPSVALLRSLRKHLDDEWQPVILRALVDGDPVAGVCLTLHGTAATYLIGWNGDQGRNLKANQYLVWQAIVYLKRRGLHWFDLGGISEGHTPGVTSFKLGLNGARYELAGEYWKW